MVKDLAHKHARMSQIVAQARRALEALAPLGPQFPHSANAGSGKKAVEKSVS